MSDKDRLKLRAIDREDVATISALLQDAVVTVGDMAFLAEENRFIFVANRFCWEARGSEADHHRVYERVLTGVSFEGVKRAQRRGINIAKPGVALELLSIEVSDGMIDLIFAAGAMVRLEIDALGCRFEDIDEPWPTSWRPRHPLDDDA